MTVAGGARRWRIFVAAVVTLAALLRLALLARKPFWSDEAWVAWLAELPLREMLATIPRTTAPVGFALATRLASLLPGPPEVTMRLIPLAAGIATVALLPRLVVALGGSRRAAAIALGLAAAMPALVHYSRELKPYALDALVATAFPLAALHLLGAGAGAPAPPGRRGRYLPAAIAAATPFFSFGGTFVVVATLAWGWARLLRGGAPGARRPWLAATAPFAVLLAALAGTLLVVQASNPILLREFRAARPPLGAFPADAVHHARELVGTAFSHQFPGGATAAMLVAGLGVLAWPRGRRGAAAAIAGGSLLLAAAAAAAGVYVVSVGRLALFAAPFTIAAAAVGVDRAAGLLDRGGWRRAGDAALAIAVACLALFWAERAVAHRLRPEIAKIGTRFLYDTIFDADAVLAELARRRAPGEPVLFGQGLRHAVRYYARGRVPPPVDFASRTRSPLRRRLGAWLPGIRARGWIVVKDNDVAYKPRAVVTAAGFAVAETKFRGALLWEVTPRETRP